MPGVCRDPTKTHQRLENFFHSSQILQTVGKTFLFECPQCQYRAIVSGGADGGLNCDVQTVICRECRKLFDVFTRVRRATERTEFARNFSEFTGQEIPPVILRESLFASKRDTPRGFEWHRIKKLSCPVSAKHFVEPWKNPGRCPRCHAFLEQQGLPLRVWD
jgi:hypothetical protein